MSRSLLAFIVGVGALLVVALGSRVALADPRTGFLADQLRTNDDYRVRTQAALALGASGDDAATQPLCQALADANPSVKVAAAAALGKLGKPDGITCLKAADTKETSASVKRQIQKSVAALQAGGGGSGPVALGPDTKFYVAIQVTNKTKRAASDVESFVRSAIQAKLLAKTGYAIAPRGETTSQGGAIVKGKSLKGFFLVATVEAPVYDGGNLTQVVRISMWTYPAKALQGEFAPKLTQTGTSQGDTESENTLMKMCIENAIDTFHKVALSM